MPPSPFVSTRSFPSQLSLTELLDVPELSRYIIMALTVSGLLTSHPLMSLTTTPRPSYSRAQMPAMRPRFPPELSDMIIDYLHEDDSSLAQTAMVCRAWLFRSRVHLFKRVVVTRDFLAFAELLLASPHVGPYIQQLVLQGRRCDFASVSPNREAVVLEPALLASILLRLPRLRSLQLLEVSFHGAATLPYLPSIKLSELVIMNVGSTVDSTDDLLHVLGLFSDIGHLCISSVTQVVEHDDPFLQGTLHIPRALKVASLKLEDVPTSTYLRVLRRTESVKTLHTVDADCVDLEDMEALSELLQQTGPSMEELMVNLAQCFNDFADGEDLDESYSLGKSFGILICQRPTNLSANRLSYHLRCVECGHLCLHKALLSGTRSVSRHMRDEPRHVVRRIQLFVWPHCERTHIHRPPHRCRAICRRLLCAPVGAQCELAASPGSLEQFFGSGEDDVHERARDRVVLWGGREGCHRG